MSIGSRIYEARLEANLSQRELAGEQITRNMLSLMEHGKTQPSLETLTYLAQRLGKKVSWFLGEDSAEVTGLPELKQAREAFRQGAYLSCLELLDQVDGGEVLGPEREMLWAEATLGAAAQALDEGKPRYCRSLLERSEARLARCPYVAGPLCAEKNLLLARSAETPAQLQAAAQALPDPDEMLTVLAKAAVAAGELDRAAALLDAVQNREQTEWNILRGDTEFARQNWEQALPYYHKAEQTAPARVRRGLQLCYEKLRNFEKAYYYATLER